MTAPRFPGDDDLARIIRHAPLVSIDIVVKDPEAGAILKNRMCEDPPNSRRCFLVADFLAIAWKVFSSTLVQATA